MLAAISATFRVPAWPMAARLKLPGLAFAQKFPPGSPTLGWLGGPFAPPIPSMTSLHHRLRFFVSDLDRSVINLNFIISSLLLHMCLRFLSFGFHCSVPSFRDPSPSV